MAMVRTKQGPVRVLELRSVRGTGGGPEKTILRGATMADPARSQVTVCYIRDERDTCFGVTERPEREGVDYVEIRERHSFDPSVWPKLRALIAERDIEVVHAHDYKTNLLALLLGRATGVAPLSTAHGWTGHSWRERACYYPADKRLLGRFPRLIAVSSDIGQELVRHGARPAAVTTVLNGIDHRQFRRDRAREAGARAALGLTAEHLVLGAVGRLEPQKRFDILLETFQRLHQLRPETRLVIAGDGSLKAALEQQRRALQLDGAVTLLGHVADVIPVHHAFDLLVQSSEYEGTPNAVLEAMALETPVVATAAGGTAELVSHNVHGRIVPVHDGDRLFHAMAAAISEPTRTRAMAVKARARVEGELSFEARVRRVETIYAEVAGHA
jgi:glycosyltransferase involved in cell wall biosynthesis